MTTYDQLLAYETNGDNPADGRRAISSERCTLHAARDRFLRLSRSGADANEALEHMREVETEALRVLKMWTKAD